jgi:hypothetical protein
LFPLGDCAAFSSSSGYSHFLNILKSSNLRIFESSNLQKVKITDLSSFCPRHLGAPIPSGLSRDGEIKCRPIIHLCRWINISRNHEELASHSDMAKCKISFNGQ